MAIIVNIILLASIMTMVANTNAYRGLVGKRNRLSLKGPVAIHLQQIPATWEW